MSRLTTSPTPSTQAKGRHGPSSPPANAGRGATVFVWGVWALLLLAALALVATYYTGVYLIEDWDLIVPRLTGEVPNTLRSLWAPYGEHRGLLFLVVAVALLKFSGGYLWAPMLFHVLTLAALAGGMILVARKLRGRTTYSDAFFPLTLLHWALGYNPIYACMLCFLVPVLILGAMLLILTWQGTRLTLAGGTAAGVCLVLLPLSSAYGLVYVPALTLWLVSSSFRQWRSGGWQGKRNSVVVLALVAVALLLVGFYFVGLGKVSPRNDLGYYAMFLTALGFLTWSVGAASTLLPWPHSGYAMFLLLAASAGVLVVSGRRGPDLARGRALGLLVFLCGTITSAAAFGWGRGDDSALVMFPAPTYYYVSTVLVLCCTYFAWMVYGPGAVGRLVQMALFFVSVLCFPLNVAPLDGTGGGCLPVSQFYRDVHAFEQDLRAGTPPYLLITRHRNSCVTMGRFHDKFTKQMQRLHQARRGAFRDLKDNPPFRKLAVPVLPTTVSEVEDRNGVFSGKGIQSSLVFSLPKPMFVAGVLLEFSLSETSSSTGGLFQVSWRRSDVPVWPQPQYIRWWALNPQLIYIAETIDEITIYPSTEPFEFQLTGLTLLVPEDSPGEVVGSR